MKRKVSSFMLSLLSVSIVLAFALFHSESVKAGEQKELELNTERILRAMYCDKEQQIIELSIALDGGGMEAVEKKMATYPYGSCGYVAFRIIPLEQLTGLSVKGDDGVTVRVKATAVIEGTSDNYVILAFPYPLIQFMWTKFRIKEKSSGQEI